MVISVLRLLSPVEGGVAGSDLELHSTDFKPGPVLDIRHFRRLEEAAFLGPAWSWAPASQFVCSGNTKQRHRVRTCHISFVSRWNGTR